MDNAKDETIVDFEKKWSLLLLGIGLIFGIFLRAWPVIKAGFPLLDGGLFYIAIEDIKNNSWYLPPYITYNSLTTPFVYPPLGFYFTGLVSSLPGISTIIAIQYVPLFFSSCTIVVLFFLAKAVLKSLRRAALAAAIFALTPRSFEWIILGGGITRSPGLLFFLLAVLNAYHLFFNNQKHRIWWVILWSSLTILSHPDATVHTIMICVLFWGVAHDKTRNFKNALLVCLGVIILTSPWWGTILARHGFGPILAASKTGGTILLGIFQFSFLNFASESFLPILTVFAFLGAGAALYRRDFLLPLWFVIPFIVHQRSAATYAAIPLSILGSFFISDVLIPRMISLRANKPASSIDDWNVNHFKVTLIVVGVVLSYSLVSTFYFSVNLLQDFLLSPDQRSAMSWVGENLPQESRFLIMTGEHDTFKSPVQEWFPALTKRESMTTTQGKEWHSDIDFEAYHQANAFLQSKCYVTSDLKCIEEWQAKTKLEFDFIYVQIGTKEPERTESLLGSLNTFHTQIYRNNEVQIFQKNK